MKRNKQVCDGEKAHVIKVWPIFSWENCVVCKKDFRREYGWRHIVCRYRSVIRYVCLGCCPTKDDALDAVEKYVQDYKERALRLRPGTLPAQQLVKL